MNLVGPGPIDEHYTDSEAAIAHLEPSGHWADLGSGAGFPGIVFAARFPHVAVDLVESRLKRCTFLEAVLLEAADAVTRRPAPLRVVCSRIEDLPGSTYDGVLARALAPPAEVLAHAGRLLRPGGTVVLFLQAGVPVPTPAGWKTVGVWPYTVGGRARQAAALTRVG
jgi:16S rRNA (guanine527-N7)-methyltransferase